MSFLQFRIFLFFFNVKWKNYHQRDFLNILAFKAVQCQRKLSFLGICFEIGKQKGQKNGGEVMNEQNISSLDKLEFI